MLAERGGGIWGRVSWTPRGAEMLANREYRFLSPSRMVAKNGVVRRIIGAGLVHRPALELKALASEEPQMSEYDDTDALSLDRAALAECFGLDAEKVTAGAVLDRLKARPDPAAFVPIEAVREFMSERQTARNALSQLEAEARVQTAMAQGHLTPAMVTWALELCQTDPESFEGFLDASPAPWKALMEPSRVQHATAAAPPRYQGRADAEAQKAICAQLGLPPRIPGRLTMTARPVTVLAALEELRHAIAGQREDLARLDGTLQDALKQLSTGGEDALTGLPPCTVPATEHRRQHRSGRPSKLDTDPELQAFVLARLDRLTFAEIAAHFPENRRVGRSSVHGWWKRRQGPRR